MRVLSVAGFLRVPYLILTIALVSVAGCGGGGGTNVAPAPAPTAAPSAVPTTAPSTAPTATPTAGTLSYAGSMSQTITTTYSNPAPQPVGTPIVQGTVTTYWTSAQSVTVSATGSPGTYDAHAVDVETGASPSPVTAGQTVSDTLYSVPQSGTGSVVELSVSSTTGTPNAGPTPSFYSDRIVTVYSGSRTVDVLPLTSGASWTNTDQRVETENAPGGNVTVRTVANNNTYTQTTVQPPLPGTAPSPVPTLFAFAEAYDGSGSYATRDSLASPNPTASAPTPNPNLNTYAYTFSAPSPTINIRFQLNGGTSVPVASLNAWFALPLALYSESDVATPGVTIPSSCQVPAAAGPTARQVVTQWTRTDTIFGTIENETLNTYEVPGLGVVCTTVSDTLTSYYNYTSGQYSATPQYAGSPVFSATSWQTVTTNQTLAITAGSLPAAARRARASLGAVALLGPRPIAVERAVAQVRHEETIEMIDALMRGAAK